MAAAHRARGRRHRVDPDDPKYANLPIVKFGNSWEEPEIVAVLRGDITISTDELKDMGKLNLPDHGQECLAYRSRRTGQLWLIPIGKLYPRDADWEEEARWRPWGGPLTGDFDSFDDVLAELRRQITVVEEIRADGWEYHNGWLYDTLSIDERLARNAARDADPDAIDTEDLLRRRPSPFPDDE